MKIIELKIIEFLINPNNLMKIMEFHVNPMKITEFRLNQKKSNENRRLPFKSMEIQ